MPRSGESLDEICPQTLFTSGDSLDLQETPGMTPESASSPYTPATELQKRMGRLRNRLDQHAPEWRVAVVTRKVSLFYLTGSPAAGTLWIPRDGEPTLFVRRGIGRVQRESLLDRIEPMRSFRDMAEAVEKPGNAVFMEKDGLSLSLFEMFNKHFGFEEVLPLDPHLAAVRAVKSEYELERIRKCGAIHAEVLERLVPNMLREDVSEAEFGAEILKAMLDRGAFGVVRINMFDSELAYGYVNFGTSSLVETNFDGPGGTIGLHPSAPFLGNRDRRLQRGQLVFADFACHVDAYHTDKTCVYCLGEAPAEAKRLHQRCVDIQRMTADRLRPGEIPSKIYDDIIAGLDDDFLENFMGYRGQQVRFLGHGVGLHIDEPPAIAKKFDEPLEENMVIALEPKRAIPDVGMVGVENTFLVTPDGGKSLTGERFELIEV